MATNFNNNSIPSAGGFKPSSKDTPLDIRTRVETESDIMNIPNPFVGMMIFVKDTKKRLEVLSLKEVTVGLTTKNAVDEYRELAINVDLKDYATKEELNSKANSEDIPTKVSQLENDKIYATESYVKTEISNAQLGGEDVDLSGYATKDELNNKANKSDIPTKVSQLENDSNYLTNIPNEYVTETELNDVLKNARLEDYQSKEDTTLSTNDKTIVGAINELFQDVDSGKQIIADAIGDENITKDSTFTAMGEAILELKGEEPDEADTLEILYNMMVEDGYNEATSYMTIDELINLLDDSNISLSSIKQISCGGNFTFILMRDGSLWSSGYNEVGVLGTNDVSDRSAFKQVTTNINNDVEKISCGYEHAFILKNDGSVWACGSNGCGQLGLDDYDDRNVFTKVTININDDVEKIASGYAHVLILKKDGSLWGCGFNYYGSLGINDDSDKLVFIKITPNINNDVKEIYCGGYHSFILKNDGSIWSCGRNNYGQLGLNNTTNKTSFTKVTTNINNDIKQIACGSSHTVILKNDGSLWCCGYNEIGQLGSGDWANKSVFTQVMSDVNMASCGEAHTFILKNDDGIYACGYNYRGQLGVEGTLSSNTFVSVPIDANVKVDESDIPRLKLYYYLLDNNIPVKEFMSIDDMLNLLVGEESNGDVENIRKTLSDLMLEGGYDITGDEDINSLLDLLVLSGISVNDIKQVACGGNHIVVLKTDGTVWGCGHNEYGQLGLGNTTNKTKFTQVTTNINNDVEQVYCGYECTFIVKNDGSLWATGYNNYGQLGLGNTTTQKKFSQVTTNINNDVKQIACGYAHTFILKNDGSVWSCGLNESGQLGLNNTTNKTTFTQVTTNINNDVKQISCCNSHTVVLKTDGTVWGCGYNGRGNLGLNNTTNQTRFTQVTTNVSDVKQIACGQNHTFIIKNDGTLWATGYNYYGHLGLGDNSDRLTFTQVTTNINNDVEQMACGEYHIFIIKNDGSVYSCGYNDYGQSGLGNTTTYTSFVKVTTNINNDVKQVYCGSNYTFIVKTDGTVWSCGYNNYGQLGLGNTTNKTKFTQVPRGF